MNPDLLAELIQLHTRFGFDDGSYKKFSSVLATGIRSFRYPVRSGQNASLLLDNGKRLIDFSSQTVNSVLGQNDRWVSYNLAANILSTQPSFLTSKLTSAYYVKAAERIVSAVSLPNKIINHKQTNGSDVTELAIKVSINASTKRKLIAFRGSYHGQSLLNYQISDTQTRHAFWQPSAENVIFVDAPPDQNSPGRQEKEDELLDTIESYLAEAFGVIIEPIQANYNMNTPSKDFIRKLDGLCRKKGVPLIFDEVQTGFGWLGKMSAAEFYGVNPGLIAFSKAITAGYGPLAVLLMDKELDNLEYGTGEKTNGADIRSLVASMAVIDRLVGVENPADLPKNLEPKLRSELISGLLERHESLSRIFNSHLMELAELFPEKIKSINGHGLILGIVINRRPEVAENLVKNICAISLENGLLVRASHSTIIIKPPLTVDEPDIECGFSILKQAIAKVLG